MNQKWNTNHIYILDAHTYMLLPLSHFSHVRLRDPIDGSPPGSPIPGILQVRTREWILIFPYIHTYDSFIYKLGTVRD